MEIPACRIVQAMAVNGYQVTAVGSDGVAAVAEPYKGQHQQTNVVVDRILHGFDRSAVCQKDGVYSF